MHKALITLFLATAISNAFAQELTPTAQDIRAGIAGEIVSFKILPEKVVKVINRTLWTGTDSVRIRLYYGSNKQNLPVIYNIHGGALVAGDLETHDNISRVLANRTQSLVVAVNYAKPPEHPFPAGINDSFYVWQWLKSHASAIGGSRSDMFMLGDSGGGLFAAALQVKLAQQSNKALQPKALVLINPATDLRNPGQGLYGLVTHCYLNGADPNNPLASPIIAKNISSFPPTLLVVCSKDELKPHGVKLAERLRAAKVKVTLLDIPNQDHLGGLWAAAHPQAKPAIDAAVAYINKIAKTP